MTESPANLLHDWHDFYILTGTASATLVGLMFVAASIGASVFSEENRAALRAFLTPTVVHFALVLFVSVLVMMPTHSRAGLGVVLALAGIGGSLYCGQILVQIVIRRHFKVDLLDRLFYALLPMVGYLLVLASAYLLLVAVPAAATLLGVALLVLLVAALRNAWDMTVWTALRAPSANTGRVEAAIRETGPEEIARANDNPAG
jgi:hypothetical protein